MTYNVFLHWPGYGNVIRANRIRSFLLDGNWGIVGLVEVYSEHQRQMILNDRNILKRYPYQLSKHPNYGKIRFFDTMSTGLMLLSRYKIVEYDLYIYHATQRKIFPFSLLSQKGVIYAEIEHKDKSLGVFHTHLFWGKTDDQIHIRKLQLQELRQFVDKKHRDDKIDIVMGDFNLMAKEYHTFRIILVTLKMFGKKIEKRTTMDTPGTEKIHLFIFYLMSIDTIISLLVQVAKQSQWTFSNQIAPLRLYQGNQYPRKYRLISFIIVSSDILDGYLFHLV